MSEIIASVYDRMEASGRKEGILFIDEVNCVSETLAPTMLQFLQCKTFGNQKVPEGWIIVCAGNPPEYNKSVRDFDVVTLDRVKVINVEPDFEVWREYAYRVGIHAAVISYLDSHRESFFRFENTVDGRRFVTARGWEDLSELIYAYESLKKKADYDVIVQYLQHPKTARDFSNYLELYYKYRRDYQTDEILDGRVPDGVIARLRYAPFDERLQIVSLLLSRLGAGFADVRKTDRTVAHVFDFVKGLQVVLKPAEESSVMEAAAENVPGDTVPGTASEGYVHEGMSFADEVIKVYDTFLTNLKNDVRSRIEAGQNEKDIREEYRGVFDILERMRVSLRSMSGNENPWDIIRTSFAKERDGLENEARGVSQTLENAFDFMENAYGESQEMVFFITQLSSDEHAMWFVGEYDCPRYYRYNKALLFDDRDADIRRELDTIRGEMAGGPA